MFDPAPLANPDRNSTASGLTVPGRTRTPDKTRVDVVKMAGATAARMTSEPGLRWSECVKPVAGTDSSDRRDEELAVAWCGLERHPSIAV